MTTDLITTAGQVGTPPVVRPQAGLLLPGGRTAAALAHLVDAAGNPVSSQGAVSTAIKTVHLTASFNRPSDATPYANGDLVANDTAAANVEPLAFPGAVLTPGGRGRLIRIEVRKSNPVTMTLWTNIFTDLCTVANGDNGAFLPNEVERALVQQNTPALMLCANGVLQGAGVSIPFKCAPGSTTLYALLMAGAAYNPVADEAFTVTLVIEQVN
jgi:hypothetical protein